MLSVVCWKWKGHAQYRSKFEAEHVNILRKMVERHYKSPHEFVCVTDDWRGLDSAVRVVPLWADLADLQSPHGELHPSCYRRLKAFDGAMAHVLGPRFVSVDLDCVITGPLEPLWDRPEPFVIWASQLKKTPYHGSMWLMDAGARAQVWLDFDPRTSPEIASKAGLDGSDQAWISYVLGSREPTWSSRDGVYSYRTEIRSANYALPPDSRIVFFQGSLDPWSAQSLRLSPWIRDHYVG